jgi:hypothetical protein
MVQLPDGESKKNQQTKRLNNGHHRIL